MMYLGSVPLFPFWYRCRYFKTIFNLSGNPAMVEKYGDWFSYERTPRALIFAREHGKIRNERDMLRLMR